MSNALKADQSASWVSIAAALLAVGYLANGGYMVSNPAAWYGAIPGVADTGPFNPHFVRDIGFMYLVTGAAMALGLYWPDQRLGLWGVAALWHMAHALFHVWEVVVGICGPDALIRDFAGVTAPSLLALVLAVVAFQSRNQRLAGG